MISLSHIRDEFWIEFPYEKFPEYCMECGIIGHPFNKCLVFLEKLDNGEEPALEYQPFIEGSAPPTSSYDRYRTDFSKGNVWPLLIQLAKKSFSAAIPQLEQRGVPQPQKLFYGESSRSTITDPIEDDIHDYAARFNGPHCNDMINNTSIMEQQTPSVIFVPSQLDHSSISIPKQAKNKSHKPAVSSAITSSGEFSDLSTIFNPMAAMSNSTHFFATYPPSIAPAHLSSIVNQMTLPLHSSTSISTPITTQSAAVAYDQENINPNVQSKRQTEGLSLRQTLKRCRENSPTVSSSTLSAEAELHHHVSCAAMDSYGASDKSAEAGFQSRNQP
uniref:Zinc knuckle CX2CX4HX4C domain-containing protein n=1 Tax=Cannabis sativa TaxID=3483 RepID=A0A803Q871_CANSA